MLVRSTAETITQSPCLWFLNTVPVSYNRKAELWPEAAKEQVFQEAGAEAAGLLKD